MEDHLQPYIREISSECTVAHWHTHQKFNFCYSSQRGKKKVFSRLLWRSFLADLTVCSDFYPCQKESSVWLLQQHFLQSIYCFTSTQQPIKVLKGTTISSLSSWLASVFYPLSRGLFSQPTFQLIYLVALQWLCKASGFTRLPSVSMVPWCRMDVNLRAIRLCVDRRKVRFEASCLQPFSSFPWSLVS